MASELSMDGFDGSWDFIWPVGRVPGWSEPSAVSQTFKDATSNHDWQLFARRITNPIPLDSSEMIQLDLFTRQGTAGLNVEPPIDAVVSFRVSGKGSRCESNRDSCFVVVISKPFTFTCCYRNYSTVVQLPVGTSNVKVCCRIVGKGTGPRQSLAAAWNELLYDDTFSDVTVRTAGKSFPAHKNILSIRSPVLRAMFRAELSECKENSVDMSTFSEPVVQGFLEFLYTDKTTIIAEYAGEWLHISDMYQVDGLKMDAEREIGEKLTVEMAVEVFYAAHLYNAQLLKRTTARFIQKNAKAIASRTSEIEQIARTSPEVTAQLVLAMHSST